MQAGDRISATHFDAAADRSCHRQLRFLQAAVLHEER
jgi:hypothetical protein